ncbi:MAG: aminotransferase class V-fold PLP-dependent enzyme [Tepidisphaerales bacterium]
MNPCHPPVSPPRVQLNSGTLYPTPGPVREAAERLRRQLADHPTDFLIRRLPQLLETSRQALAGYLHADPRYLLLLPNVTFAMNLVVSSLNLTRGTQVLLTDHSYGAMTYIFQRWAMVRDWTITVAEMPVTPASEDELFDAIVSQLNSATRIAFFYHVTSPTGLTLPIARLCAYCRERDILTIVDGAHAPGTLPLDLDAIGADFYGGNLHKWMMGPATAAFLYVSPHRRVDLRPLVTSWGFDYERSRWNEDTGCGGSRWQWDLEFHGTADRVPQCVVPEMLAFRRQLGGDAALRTRALQLGDLARKIVPLPCASPHDPALRSPMVVFDVHADTDAVRARERLAVEFGVEAPVTSVGGRKFLRVSIAHDTEAEHLHALAEAVRQGALRAP